MSIIEKPKKNYRAKGLAAVLDVSVATVWRWTKEGKIKSHKISSGTTIFNIDEVMKDLGLNGDFE